MNNLFIEGPIQTGKSTLIRKVLREVFGKSLDGVVGFTSQRLINADGQLMGFRLAPASSELTITIDTSDMSDLSIPSEPDNIFKFFTSDGALVDMNVFETSGTAYLEEAFASAKAGQARLILLDEIGGHELKNDTFRCRLFDLLDSEIPCVGVIKSPANTRRMDDSLLELNEELHAHVSVVREHKIFESMLRSICLDLI